ncbi:MAG: Cell division protein ftsA [Parcubacteria group bacterium Gr01-1014_48]|nr:MAG: Cell division protein ftsA [Parcubacteria group bacterium Greene0416_14]TSC73709.1 MAG: Cell division protein ftsA [Parcubacteria group bacterium Gr01-1014_48]TSC99247.1 MAG: Cell division protein ftsA [Parcubacteria group bacterium Greene1014_15]TSD06926.1 MAG: Cell division protein ftsA [Parcubacteria group bacterium Greene0714_4]
MSRNIVTGIDIGTHRVKVVIAERSSEKNRGIPHIIGRGLAESKGLRHGYIINTHEAVRSIRAALAAAERKAEVQVKRAYVSIGGISLESAIATGSTSISRGDSEITEADAAQVAQNCEQAIPQHTSINRKVIHAIPLQYKIDGKPVIGRPVGMKGVKLEAKTLFVTALEQHLNDMIQAIEESGIEVLDVMAAPLAASLVTLTRPQKIAGVVLANIGAETVSIVVFENNIPISLQVFPLGSTDITNDLALGFKISLTDAEALKTGVTDAQHSRKQFEEIISARISDILELIEAHLKKLGKNGLLPAGIVLTGGGSSIASIEEMAQTTLKLPSRIAIPNLTQNTDGELQDVVWSVAYGLCLLGFSTGEEQSMGIRIAKQTKNKVLHYLKKFLP